MVEETPENFYALRVTPYPNNDKTIKELKEALPQLFKGDYCYGVEFAKNHHIHAVFLSEDYDKETFKENLYNLLKTIITDYDDSKKGNAVFSCNSVTCLDKAVQYALKDGKHFCDGSPDWIEYCMEQKKNSFTKPQSIRELMENLYLRFEDNELNERTLWIEMVAGRAQFPDVKTRYADIDAFIETFKIRKLGIEYVTQVWEDREARRNL